jgi:hypothetical protein
LDLIAISEKHAMSSHANPRISDMTTFGDSEIFVRPTFRWRDESGHAKVSKPIAIRHNLDPQLIRFLGRGFCELRRFRRQNARVNYKKASLRRGRRLPSRTKRDINK